MCFETNMHLMTFGDVPPFNFKLPDIIFKYHHCVCPKIPEILGCYMIFHCRLTSHSAAAPAPSGYVAQS